MQFELNEDQTMVKDSARKFLTGQCPMTLVRELEQSGGNCPDGLWQAMAELGWMGLMTPEEYGGFGMGFNEMAVLLEEMGYACLPGPFFSSAVLAGLTVLQAGSEAQKQDLLPRMASGELKATLAWLEEAGRYEAGELNLKAEPDGGGYSLSGVKMFVPDAAQVDLIIVAARTADKGADPEQGISLLLVPADSPGLEVVPLDTIARDQQCMLRLDGVKLPAEALLGGAGNAWPVLRKVQLMAGVAKCAEMIGGAERVMEMVKLQTAERVQFGRPIGKFQAVQHHCADILTYYETAKVMTTYAAWLISQDEPFELHASMCKSWVSDAYRDLAGLAHAVLGGIGFMQEHDMQMYYRRAKAAELAFGDAEYHRQLVAGIMGV